MSRTRGRLRTYLFEYEEVRMTRSSYFSRIVTALRVPTLRRVDPVTKQDRTPWNQKQIEEGVTLISATLSRGQAVRYQLRAAIVAVHDGCRDRVYSLAADTGAV
jgi:hypothetical protein